MVQQCVHALLTEGGHLKTPHHQWERSQGKKLGVATVTGFGTLLKPTNNNNSIAIVMGLQRSSSPAFQMAMAWSLLQCNEKSSQKILRNGQAWVGGSTSTSILGGLHRAYHNTFREFLGLSLLDFPSFGSGNEAEGPISISFLPC